MTRTKNTFKISEKNSCSWELKLSVAYNMQVPFKKLKCLFKYVFFFTADAYATDYFSINNRQFSELDA